MKYTLSRTKKKENHQENFCLSFSLLDLFFRSWKFVMTETRAYNIAHDENVMSLSITQSLKYVYVHMRGEMNSNRLEISFRWKILLQCSVCSLLVSTWNEGKWNESGMDFILVILTEMKFQAGMRFSSEKKLPKTKWISADSLDIVLNAHVRLNILASVISSYSFW